MNSEPTAETKEEPTVTYYGSHTRKVDAKGRFHLPFQFRPEKTEDDAQEAVQDEYMICPGPHGSWALMPMNVWVVSFNAKPEEMDKGKVLMDRRKMSRNSYTTIPDKQGRVAIPPMVKGPLGVDREILIVGMGATMELWAPDKIDGGEAGAQLPSDDYLIEFFG